MIEFGPKLERVNNSLFELTSQGINSYDDAFLTCLTCDHRGYYDWRLPTRKEYFDEDLMSGAWYESKPSWRRAWYVIPVRDNND
jgi:hypothetical protein